MIFYLNEDSISKVYIRKYFIYEKIFIIIPCYFYDNSPCSYECTDVNGDKVSPYLRTAIGFNLWDQNFTDGTGNKINVPNTLPDLAYQLGLGVKFKITERTGLFIEGGYGKYILHGGLSFKI